MLYPPPSPLAYRVFFCLQSAYTRPKKITPLQQGQTVNPVEVMKFWPSVQVTVRGDKITVYHPKPDIQAKLQAYLNVRKAEYLNALDSKPKKSKSKS